MARHRGDHGLAWEPEWPTVELKRPAPGRAKRRRDWAIDAGQVVVGVCALVHVAAIALIWSGHPKPAEGAVWSAVLGSWVAICAVVAGLLQRWRRD
jgi:hypothetical protein